MLKRTFSIGQTQKNFSKVVWFYDFWGKLTESKAISRAINVSNLSNNRNVLEVGVGTGRLLKNVLKINFNGLNAGIDLSFSMLIKAKEKLNPDFSNFALTLGNALSLPFKDSSMDYIFSSYVFDLLPENSFETVLKEFKRIMKNGGSGVIVTMSMGEKWFNRIWYFLAKHFPDLLTNCRPVDISNYIEKSGFKISNKIIVSQNTFPSEIIKFENKN